MLLPNVVFLFRKTLIVLRLYLYYVVVSAYCKLEFCSRSKVTPSKLLPVFIVDHNFIQDINALEKQASIHGVKLTRLPYLIFYLLADVFFPENIRDKSYVTDQMAAPRSNYNKIVRVIFSLWRPEKKISCFLTPSDSFFWIREVIIILRERGIPCVVIDKEGTISPHSMEHHSRQIAECYPFISDYIIVWSERQKEFWQRTGVSEDKIQVAGQPRSDFFFDRSAWLPRAKLPCGDKPLVLFFTFETDAYAPTPGDHIWRDLRHDLHTSLISLAKNYPDISFVVKTHPQQADRMAVEDEFTTAGIGNIAVLHGPELARHLIVHADVVIGFQTTALIEAMLVGKRVIYTEWSSEVCANRRHLIPFHEAKGIDIVHSRLEFDAVMDSLLRQRAFSVSREELTARKPFVDIYIPNADGNVSCRVMRQVRRIIDNRSGTNVPS